MLEESVLRRVACRHYSAVVAGSYPPLAEVDPECSEGDGACLPAGRVDRPQRERLMEPVRVPVTVIDGFA